MLIKFWVKLGVILHQNIILTKIKATMKKFILSLCFAAFLGGGLVSCTDEAAEVTPSHKGIVSPVSDTDDPLTKGKRPKP